MNHQAKIQAAVAGIVALGFASLVAAQPVAQKDGTEKCYGVAKAGQNDCGTAKHACAGQGAKTRQRPDRMEVRRQGHVREDGRQDDRAEVSCRRSRQRGAAPSQRAARRAVCLVTAPRFPSPPASACARRTCARCSSARPRVPVVRGPQRELLRRRRAGARDARAHPRRLSDRAARRRPVARLRRSARPRAPAQARRGSPIASSPPSSPSTCAGAASTGATSTISCRCRTRRRRSITCARACQRGAGRSRPRDPGRERVELLRVPGVDDPRVRVRRRGRRAHRLQAAGRRQQHLRQRAQPRHRRARLSRGDRARVRRRDPSRRLRRQRPDRHRHARRAGRAGSVVALRARRSRASAPCRR